MLISGANMYSWHRARLAQTANRRERPQISVKGKLGIRRFLPSSARGVNTAHLPGSTCLIMLPPTPGREDASQASHFQFCWN